MSEKNRKPTTRQKVEQTYAWITIEPDGGEYLCTLRTRDGMNLSLIGADRKHVESYRKIAEYLVRTTGLTVRLKQFSAVTVLDEITVKNKV